MKHGLRQGYLTRDGHVDTTNIKKYRTPTLLYIYKSSKLKIKIYTYLPKLCIYLIEKKFY
jgi:hypothetical protein